MTVWFEGRNGAAMLFDLTVGQPLCNRILLIPMKYDEGRFPKHSFSYTFSRSIKEIAHILEFAVRWALTCSFFSQLLVMKKLLWVAFGEGLIRSPLHVAILIFMKVVNFDAAAFSFQNKDSAGNFLPGTTRDINFKDQFPSCWSVQRLPCSVLLRRGSREGFRLQTQEETRCGHFLQHSNRNVWRYLEVLQAIFSENEESHID